MPLILHVSKDFAKRYGCQLSLAGKSVPQTGRLDSWSAHYVRITRKPVVLAMNDATLWSIIIPATGITTQETLLPILVARIDGIRTVHGLLPEPAHRTVMFFSRSNRSLIGSMNDVVFRIQVAEETARKKGRPMDWEAMETYLNEMPYAAIDFDSPGERMAKLLDGGG